MAGWWVPKRFTDFGQHVENQVIKLRKTHLSEKTQNVAFFIKFSRGNRRFFQSRVFFGLYSHLVIDFFCQKFKDQEIVT